MWRRGTFLQASVYILLRTVVHCWQSGKRAPEAPTRDFLVQQHAPNQHTSCRPRAHCLWQVRPWPPGTCAPTRAVGARTRLSQLVLRIRNQLPEINSKSITRQPLQYSVSRSVPCFMPPWLHSRSRSCRFCRVNHRAIFHVSALVPGAKLSDSSSLTSWNPNALYIFLAGVKRLFV